MNIELRYFTGTGNSLKILETCHVHFVKSANTSNITEIRSNETTISAADLLGFCFPVYAFGIPRICYDYLKGLERFKKQQKVFILITAGDSDESGFAITECERVLFKKNCDVVYSEVIQMPINWTTASKPPFPPSIEEAKEIIKKGESRACEVAADILAETTKHHGFNYPKRYSKLKFYWEYLGFKYLGLPNLWRLFRVYDSCNGCQICAKICPTNSIRIVDKRPFWSKTCEQCMRCVNYCPTESIYQLQGGDTRGKNKYHEPGFKPQSNKK